MTEVNLNLLIDLGIKTAAIVAQVIQAIANAQGMSAEEKVVATQRILATLSMDNIDVQALPIRAPKTDADA